jgi:hypothetical protein
LRGIVVLFLALTGAAHAAQDIDAAALWLLRSTRRAANTSMRSRRPTSRRLSKLSKRR